MSSLLEYFTKGGPINKDNFLNTLQANPGAASDVDPKTGNTPLHFVCCNGAPRDLVEPLLQANPTAAATADLDGFLPLVGALSCGAAADVIDLLLAANPAAASTKVDGRTPLHYAVSHGCDVRVTKALVRLFPDVCACVEIKLYGAFVLNRRVVLHAIDATPARWRGDADSSPFDRAWTGASSPRNDLVKNCAPVALVDFHTDTHRPHEHNCAGTRRRH